MAAPLGNTYWQNRKRHGRHKTFVTPDDLEQAFIDYFQWCDENPWIKKDFIRGGPGAGEIVDIPTPRPYTIWGFQAHFGLGYHYIDQLEDAVKEKDDQTSKDFSAVLSWARNVCFTNKFEGAAVGLFNSNLVSRALGLSDKQDITANAKLDIQQITGMEVK